MLNPEQLIKSINKDCKSFFINSFKLSPYSNSNNLIVYRLEGNSKALNRFELQGEQVNVLHWFEDYWLFLEVKFIILRKKENRKSTTLINTQISMSIFQGYDNDELKIQLFRAEWDDFNNSEENHPQPHWHITSNLAIERTFEDYSNRFDNSDFISLLKEVKSKIVNVNEIHFAMNGNWQSGENHIHCIDDAVRIVKWFQGVFHHLRTELEEIK